MASYQNIMRFRWLDAAGRLVPDDRDLLRDPHPGRGLGGHLLAQEAMRCGLCGLPYGEWARFRPCPGLDEQEPAT